MLALMMATGVNTVMDNHYYTIGGDIRKQEDRGCIGSDMTGEVTRVEMLEWDEEFEKRCKLAECPNDMYGRYVDDSTIVTRAINRGWRYINGRMMFSRKTWEDDAELDDEARTVSVLAAIANSIHPNIQVTTDHPSKSENGRMAVLDLEMWVDVSDGIPKWSTASSRRR